MFRSNRAWLGCAITATTIRIVHLTMSGGIARVSGIVTQPLAERVDQDDEPQALRAALERLRARHPRLPRRAAAALPSQRVLLRCIDVPAASDVELAAVLNWEAERQLDIELDANRIDFMPLRGRGAEQRTVLVAAVRKDYADACTRAFQRAGFDLVVLDAGAAALHNAFAANYDAADAVLLDGDDEETTVHAIVDTLPRITRTIAGAHGGDSARAVEAALVETGVPRPCPVFVSGAAYADPRRVAALAERLSLTVERLNPFQRVPAGGLDVDACRASEFAVACGAGLRLGTR